MWAACRTSKLILNYSYGMRENMLKWARERVRTLILPPPSHEDGVALGSPDVQQLGTMVVKAQRANRHLAAISSVGCVSLAACNMLTKRGDAPTQAPMSARRPGMDARWKERNRVPIQNMQPANAAPVR